MCLVVLTSEQLNSDQAAWVYFVHPVAFSEHVAGRVSLMETYFHEMTLVSYCCYLLPQALRAVTARMGRTVSAAGSELVG